MGSTQLILATRNPHKVEEFRRLFSSSIEIVSLDDIGFETELPPEKESSHQENSFQKAEFVGRRLQKACLADDSGFEVDALGNQPGVLSARFGGFKNSKKQRELILQKLEGETNRKAAFVCILSLFDPATGGCLPFVGKVEGVVSDKDRGKGGFGYDAIFIPKGAEKSFGEMSAEEKDRYSHRAKAAILVEKFLLSQKEDL